VISNQFETSDELIPKGFFRQLTNQPDDENISEFSTPRKGKSKLIQKWFQTRSKPVSVKGPNRFPTVLTPARRRVDPGPGVPVRQPRPAYPVSTDSKPVSY
jgi:hypothetical protein